MENRWKDDQAATCDGLLDECVYASRLLGADTALVLHGGGNTSVKIAERDLYGDPVDVLYVKASGWDLVDIDVAGFAPLRVDRVRRLVELDELSDTEMFNELRGSLLSAGAPTPSVEAILHAIVPDIAVQHTHPNALLAISNTVGGEDKVRELYGDRAVVVPYAMSGFRAARAAARAFKAEATDKTLGVVLMNHGLFTFGRDPREAYHRMVELVTDAESFLSSTSVGGVSVDPIAVQQPVDRVALAKLRNEISAAAGSPMLVHRHRDSVSWAFSQRDDLEAVAMQGPATPDHVIWTKRVPLLGRDVATYAKDYEAYFDEHSVGRELRMLDPAPRVILDPVMGMLSAGPDVAAETAAGDIYLQIISVVEQAEGLGGYSALSPRDIFDLEYWELEQAKLDRVKEDGEFTGEVAVVTGSASGIGRACALELLDRGAAVIGLDISPDVAEMTDHSAYLGIPCDLTSLTATAAALDGGVERFGGVDLLVASAGLFPESAPISAHDPAAWRRAMSVNVDGLVQLLSLMHPLLLQAPRGGRVVVIGSKNVAAPGPGASAYSASKAAANQIARVAALEWANDKIRVNSVHPDAVFDTALWTPELLAERAARYGMTIDEYKRRNLMGVEITSAAVANVVATML
ncbi:MAG: bifunctional aldolase/short-chain dehydrogenase, partial [Acidimicrobiia bacterium]|nr:bifunctional aldolase/short-chain dehydrogenase [Acidimicrobiia bacterium]MDX2468838.1 bifunctional aldolase/short-chain dehydrogenase [Acidimicrobiia bacterium]